METTRRVYTAEQKVVILREHLLEGKPVSDVCDRQPINPTPFYEWQKQFFENGTAAFAKPSRSGSLSKGQEKRRRWEEKLKPKDEVMAELLPEPMTLKKSLGEIGTDAGCHRIPGMR